MGKNHRTKFVGMDVHQKSISIALADDGPDGEVRLYGTIKNTPEAIEKLIRKLVSTGAELHLVMKQVLVVLDSIVISPATGLAVS